MPSKCIKQHDMSDCGAACLASVCANYGLHLPISRIRILAETDNQGTNIMGLLQGAKKLGFDAKGVKGDRESLFKIPLPAIAHVALNESIKHYVVIYEINASFVRLMDPANGKMHKINWKKFLNDWTGVLVILLPSDSFKKGNEKFSVWKRFWLLITPHKQTLIQVIVGSLLYTLLGFSTSVFIQKITDHVLISGNTSLLNVMGFAMIFILIFQLLLSIWKDIFMIQAGQEIDARLVLGYQKHLLGLPQRFFDTMKVGEIISRIGDALKIRVFVSHTSMSIVVNFFIVLFSFTIMLSYYWKLGLLMMAMLPFYLIVFFISDFLNRKSERKVMECSARLESHLVESLQGIRTIKQFGAEEFTLLNTEIKFLSLLKEGYRSSMNQIFGQSSMFAIQNVFTILLLWMGSYYVIGNKISTGQLLSFYSIIGYLTGPISALILSNKSLQNALIAADRLFEIIDMRQENDTIQKEINPEEFRDIVFNQVVFSYNNRIQVLKGFSATIKTGRITAIVGNSGSGKSTLMHLLQSLYPLEGGNIKIGGIDLKYITSDSLRNKISVVPQVVQLFSGTVAENIALGDPDIDFGRILEVVSLLGMESFIENLENGLYTFIGENGLGLSGGQKQRIAIARALYKTPEVLLLDEASSSLDQNAEEALISALVKMKSAGKTVVLISHRFNTVLHADTILVLDNGRLVEQGSHDELMANKLFYYKLWVKETTDGSVPVVLSNS